MDYPAEPRPAIVGAVKQGVAEPTVGYVFSFSRGLGCWGGLGLGVDGRSLCQVVLVEGRSLVIDGNDWGIARASFRCRRSSKMPPKPMGSAMALPFASSSGNWR